MIDSVGVGCLGASQVWHISKPPLAVHCIVDIQYQSVHLEKCVRVTSYPY